MSADEIHSHHVLGGHKAAIHNAHVGPAAKLHSVGVLNDAEIDVNVHHGVATFDPPTFHEKKAEASHAQAEAAGGKSDAAAEGSGGHDAHRARVLGGYKATLANGSSSEAAKEHAREKLREAGEKY